MTRRSFALAGFALGAVATIVVLARRMETDAVASPDEPARDASAGATPVLVELFTSEGCSSCPPADAVLARLERTQPVAGARVVPLALHVDYWDSIGWPDPFAASSWTARQRRYASVIGGGSYTPEAVIDGRVEMTGSRAGALESAIAEAAKRAHASIDVGVAPAATGDAFEITLKVGVLPSGAAEDAELVVALTQDRARIAVPRGENSGKTLDHTAIARDLRVVGGLSTQGGTLKTSLKPPPGIAAKDLHVVAFVQERATRRVLGVATRPLTGS